MDFLYDNNNTISIREAHYIFHRLDYNQDGLISYNDFVDSILPQENEKLKNLASVRDSMYLRPDERLPYEVKDINNNFNI